MAQVQSPGNRALILVATLVAEVDKATKGSFILRGMLNSSKDAKRMLAEARAIVADAKKEQR
jgi:hypothetical protein